MDLWNCKAALQFKVMQYYTEVWNILQAIVSTHFYHALCLSMCLVTVCQTYPRTIFFAVRVLNFIVVCVVFVLNVSLWNTKRCKILHSGYKTVQCNALCPPVGVLSLVAKYILQISLRFVSYFF